MLWLVWSSNFNFDLARPNWLHFVHPCGWRGENIDNTNQCYAFVICNDFIGLRVHECVSMCMWAFQFGQCSMLVVLIANDSVSIYEFNLIPSRINVSFEPYISSAKARKAECTYERTNEREYIHLDGNPRNRSLTLVSGTHATISFCWFSFGQKLKRKLWIYYIDAVRLIMRALCLCAGGLACACGKFAFNWILLAYNVQLLSIIMRECPHTTMSMPEINHEQ